MSKEFKDLEDSWELFWGQPACVIKDIIVVPESICLSDGILDAFQA